MRCSVPPRHPFRKLRNYHEVWPFVEGEDDWWMTASDPRPKDLPPVHAGPVDAPEHPCCPYFNRRLRDSKITSVAVVQGAISIQLNDIQLQDLSAAMATRLGRGFPKAAFPIEITFEKLNAWAAFQWEPLGELVKLKHSLASNLRRAAEWRGDLVSHWTADRFVGFFEFRVHRCRLRDLNDSGKQSWPRVKVIHDYQLLLAIDCQSVTVQECNREVWCSLFGANYGYLFDAFQRDRAQFRPSGYADCRRFVDLHMTENN